MISDMQGCMKEEERRGKRTKGRGNVLDWFERCVYIS